ncbi:MAG: glycosyltransferase [Planctomycetaceae bacterium]|jgi:glycosyltransferase involved in cell wall biosynthesis
MSIQAQTESDQIDCVGRLLCSVVIPVFNRCDQLRRVLSLLSCQSVATSQFEVIVCDDGSTESLKQVITEFQVGIPQLRYLRQENRGPAAARNLGVLHAASEIVLFLDSDVEPSPQLISELTGALDAHPDWTGAEARLEPVGGEETPRWDAPRTASGGRYHTAGIAYRTEVFRRAGGMDESFLCAACEDVELAVRVLEEGTIGFVSSAVVYHPRRQRTIMSCWTARQNWRFVRILASRYGFLSWPDKRTNFPRLRTAIAAAVSLPWGRLRTAVRHMGKSPRECVRGIFLSVVDWTGGIFMMPTILFEATPRRRSSVRQRESAR